MRGERIIITGATRAGKSTALHRLILFALKHRSSFTKIIIGDGKGGEHYIYAPFADVYLPPDDLGLWADTLRKLADELPRRYEKLAAKGVRSLPSPRGFFLALDEIQSGTRDPKHGKIIHEALCALFEKTAALGDTIILATQRLQHSLKPSLRLNTSIFVRMQGEGFFTLHRKEESVIPEKTGRTRYLDFEEIKAILLGKRELQYGDGTLFDILTGGGEEVKAVAIERPWTVGREELISQIRRLIQRRRNVLLLGEARIGKSHILRVIEAEWKEANRPVIRLENARAKKQVLLSICFLLYEFGDLPPPLQLRKDWQAVWRELRRWPTDTLLQLIAQNIKPDYLVIFDNAHSLTPTGVPVIVTLSDHATVIAACEKQHLKKREALSKVAPRFRHLIVPPLDEESSRELLWHTLSRENTKHPEMLETKILRQAGGKPGVIVDLARRDPTSKADIREAEHRLGVPHVDLTFLLLVLAFIFIFARYFSRATGDMVGYVIFGSLSSLAFLIRSIIFWHRRLS